VCFCKRERERERERLGFRSLKTINRPVIELTSLFHRWISLIGPVPVRPSAPGADDFKPKRERERLERERERG
jgi:hypothetical protein